MNIETVWGKASSLRGCLSHLKTTVSRRRYNQDEDPLSVCNIFVSDEAKILCSKGYRVMGEKTQVFTLPENALVRNRQKHVGEVVAVSVVASELLGLNTDLVRAMALGHDIGHVPFAHQGEAWMAKTMNKPFCHEVMGPIIAQKIERKGAGLNLTFETLEGMMCHSGSKSRENMTPEAWALRYADKFAYIFHDVNDIIVRAGYPVSKELLSLVNEFGATQRERTTTVIAGLVTESAECGKVSFQYSELAIKFSSLRSRMYEIYVHVTQQNVGSILEPILEFLTMINIGDPFLLLALMTDKDATLIASTQMRDMRLFNRTTVSEIAPYIASIGHIDLCDPDLNW